MESKENFGFAKDLGLENEIKKEQHEIEEVFSGNDADFFIADSDKKTEQEINEEVMRGIDKKCWWLDKEWREKGAPKEQIEISIGENKITLYNFNSEIKFLEGHEKEMREVMEDYYREDPELFSEVKYILINDRQNASLLGNEEDFPLNGGYSKAYGSISLSPRGMRQDIGFRVPGISNFKGVVAHEFAHPEIKDRKNAEGNKKEKEWMKKFGWDYCQNYPDEWREVEIDGGKSMHKNNITGEIVFDNFTVKPELCLNDYTRKSYEEDMCDSRVAYFYNSELLKKVCPEKYELAGKFGKVKENNGKKAEIKFKKIPPDQIKLPEKHPKKFTYYKEKVGDGLDM